MKKLNTIQKKGKLNDVYVLDEKGNGGANHVYMICKKDKDILDSVLVDINFQKGPRKEGSSTNGILDTDLLEIVRHRLQGFQEGPYSSRENACALTHIEEALMWLNRRVEDRIERDVLGTNNK
ncbi:ABC transporter ATPase [Clostridium botulinum]|nr:ABC transporter ATPase [Clostridium botulinum]NEZ98783.1 ABC transporter ATPase [Clostridium botulinum]NFA31573.1 ABC transporter ATPase [Clostridium botulinum]NFA86259.1 ABC transporter ATPase [Clostridium botulinum]NFB04804.1 ABC transporter ATPase [Clostridium botulinum]